MKKHVTKNIRHCYNSSLYRTSMCKIKCFISGMLRGPQPAQCPLMDLPAAVQPATQYHVMVKG